MMRTYAPSEAIVKTGLAQPFKAKPACPKGDRKGRWSPPAPQG